MINLSDQNAIKVNGMELEGLTVTENIEEAVYTRIIRNTRDRPDYIEDKVYELFNAKPCELHPNGERFIISEKGRQDFGWLMACKVEFYK